MRPRQLHCRGAGLKGKSVPFADIGSSHLTSGLIPTRIHYREEGGGFPLIFLHGGWGYEIYPFDRQIEAFNKQFRIIIPDRSGYGRSTKIKILPTDFHELAAMEMIGFLDALSIQHALIWGHSDGAVIAAMMALSAPERINGLILEAFHYFKVKPGSERFFSSLAQDPDQLGERISHGLKLEHGEEHWRNVIKMNSEAWLKIAAESKDPSEDLFGGNFKSCRCRPCSFTGHRIRVPNPGRSKLSAKSSGRRRFT